GHERLVAAGEAEEIRRRHLDYALRLVEAAAEEPVGASKDRSLRRLEAERENLWAALQWGHGRGGRGGTEAARRLTHPLASLTAPRATPSVRSALAPLLAELHRLALPSSPDVQRLWLAQTDAAVLTAGADLYQIIGDHPAEDQVLARLQELEPDDPAGANVLV